MTRLFILLALALPLFAQSYKPTYQSNPNLNLDSVLAGVKVVWVGSNKEWQKKVDRGENEEQSKVVKKYLDYLGFSTVAITSEEKSDLSNKFGSLCDAITFDYGYYFEKEIDRMKVRLWIAFSTCMHDQFYFEVPVLIEPVSSLYSSEFSYQMLKEWEKLYTRKKIYYNVKQRSALPKVPTNWTVKSVWKYLDSANIDSVEGIYEVMKDGSETIPFAKNTIAVIKTDNLTYTVIYLWGANNWEDWDEGEIQAGLRKTAVPGTFRVDWFTANKSVKSDVYMEHDPKGILLFRYETPLETHKYIKLYPIKW